MQDNGSVPVAGLAVGVGFVILISSWSAFSPMHAGDYIRIGNSNGLVKSFLQIFPDAYVTAEEHIDNSTGTKWVSLYYTTSEPWNGDNRYEIPVSLRVINSFPSNEFTLS